MYLRAFALAVTLAAITGAATYLLMGIQVIPFGIPREAWAIAVALFFFAFTMADQVRQNR